MSKFKKGISGNPEGRPKGSRNKTTTEMKKIINELFNDELENVKIHLNKLDSKERLDFLIKLMPYVLPKQVETELPKDMEKYLDKVPLWLRPNIN